MIAFVQDFLPHALRNRFRIRIPEPSTYILVTGADKEAISAEFDDQNRMTTLVVHTRSGRPCEAAVYGSASR